MPNSTHLKKTKIIATIGPTTEDERTIKELILQGVNVFRFNTKHSTLQWHIENIKKVQKAADKIKWPVGILLDLQGPEVRIATVKSQDVPVIKNKPVCFAYKPNGIDEFIQVPTKQVFEVMNVDDDIVLDDGRIMLTVTKVENDKFWAISAENNTIETKKTLNLFGKDLNVPSLVKKDLDRLSIAAIEKVDYIALSFVRTKRDIQALRRQMDKRKINAQIVAKIESQKGLDNIDEIIDEADVVMVARGDLGIETPLEHLAYTQKSIIKKCRAKQKTVIVATQMLESMVYNPMPTRAEATDVANAVLDGADALMLSGETATGAYPVKAVDFMAKIAKFNENKSELEFDFEPNNPTKIIVKAAEVIAQKSVYEKLDFIVIFTETGYTARILSSLRPKTPIIAATALQKTVETLTMSFGVNPVKVRFPKGNKGLIEPKIVLDQLVKAKVIKKGDQILVIHGQHWQVAGQTNAIVLLEA